MKTSNENQINKGEIWENTWIPTQCHRCHSECAIRVQRINGVAAKIEGNFDSPIGSRGGVCPKGISGLQLLYDPNRLKYPLRRTNPEKGIGVDPQWERISWDEAYTTIAGKLKDAMDKDPSGIVIQHGILAGTHQTPFFYFPLANGLTTEKGHPGHFLSAGSHCGNALHFVAGINHGAFIEMPDWDLCNYALIFGSNSASGGFQQFTSALSAKARVRGMKMVVFDPVCNNGGSKATEWIPCLPGTDGAIALGMLNVIVNELGMIDVPFLSTRTDAPYLVGEDKKYVRDVETNKPMIWDGAALVAKVFDDETIGEYALEGSYEVNGKPCKPAWALLKNRFAEYDAEKVEKISEIPAETLRRIAREFAEAASIGSTITIDGKELPFRPVSTYNVRAAVTHTNATQALYAMDLLNLVVGSANSPGGVASLSTECFGHPDTGQPLLRVDKCPDGFIKIAGRYAWPRPWPLNKPEKPTYNIEEMFPCAMEIPLESCTDYAEIQRRIGLRTEYDVLINYCSNALMNGTNPKDRERYYKDISFIVDIDLFSNEFNEAFADILLPDASYLERSDWSGAQHTYHGQPPGMDSPWCFHVTQKIVEPMYERVNGPEIVIELMDRIGATPKVNAYYNDMLHLAGANKLDPDKKIEWMDLCDRAVRQIFGEKYTWEWFKQNGWISWPKKVEEVYWRQFNDARSHVYWEFLVDLKEGTYEIAKELNIDKELKWDAYDPLPFWFPNVYEDSDPEFNLYAFSWAEAMHVGVSTQQQPWIDEVSKLNPFSYYININEKTAEEEGLAAGDLVEVESYRGLKVQGQLQVRKAQHPRTLTIMGVSGHWAKGLPIAKGKGANFNSLIDMQFSDVDPITGNLEVCVKVKVKKIG